MVQIIVAVVRSRVVIVVFISFGHSDAFIYRVKSDSDQKGEDLLKY